MKMFSFWSNDEDENSDCGKSDKKTKKGKEGRPPVNERYGHFSKDLNTFSNNVFQNNRNAKVLKEKTKQMDDMLKGVWSVRKDVRVNNPVKASDVSQKSYYSRYNMSKGEEESKNGKNSWNNRSAMKKWQVERPDYLHAKAVDTGDILSDENDTQNTYNDVQQNNIANIFKDNTTGNAPKQREMSARTKSTEVQQCLPEINRNGYLYTARDENI
ncbi:uncharacterized protein LOC124442327 isoform X2 [Xenia sp. Carnegie-2017]|uniref:uncharacterized protein LOC124442327 isoform X2 n=1 Tax=Xenia sp. Carnegie-2017 TaxID=2897299 RepID=UPI001F040C5F|nr:uncharacterized protein LOC124442327 isoform X2 [Xenia sp. Carnegie-2017]